MNRNYLVFAICWLIVFIVYYPAAGAGRVGDFPGWVQAVTTRSFTDYINRTGSGIPSLYQFTQVVTCFFYQLFGASAWPWHLLYITLQAANGLLLFIFFRRIFTDSFVRNGDIVSFSGVLLFCLCPHISEVVVWEPSFHYLLGLMLMLGVLLCTRSFLKTQKAKFAWWGGLLFFLSTYSLEVFYLTPLFVVSLAVYYRFALNASNAVFKKTLLCFTLPQILLFALHLAMLRVIYNQGVAHVGSIAIQFNLTNLSKSLKYIFHLLLFGRFLSQDVRNNVYHFCESWPGLLAFYGTVVLVVTYALTRFSKLSQSGKSAFLLFIWVGLSLGLILPLWFPDTGIVLYDRYTYVLDAFIYMLVALQLNNIFKKYLFIAAVVLYSLANYRFTHKANAYWQQSAAVVNNLVSTFPNDPTKIVLLLNLPECLDGVQMVGTRDDGEFRMMYNSIMPRKITNDVYDVEAFYMRSPQDGAHVNVVNDTAVKVTLNQWGTWWLYYGYGATSYENKDFKVNMRDPGHWYELILKRPAADYLLLYVADGKWHTVDLARKDTDQY